MERFKELVSALRGLRADLALHPGEPLLIELEGGEPPLSWAALEGLGAARPGTGAGEGRPLQLSFGRALVWRAAGEFDRAGERARLQAEADRVRSELERARRQLANPKFVERAPEHLVQAEVEKEARFAAELEALEARLRELGEG
jgi:valyl-tRNA synthetase